MDDDRSPVEAQMRGFLLRDAQSLLPEFGPCAIAIGRDAAERYVVVTGVQAARFLIEQGPGERRPLVDLSGPLACLSVRRELLHVVASVGRTHPLRVAWLVVGREATLPAALRSAADALRGAVGLLGADERVAWVPVGDAEDLGMLMSTVNKAGTALLRVPFCPAISLRGVRPGAATFLPWTGARSNWTELLCALAQSSTSLVVRLIAGVPPDAAELAGAEAASREATELLARVGSMPVRDGPLVAEAEAFDAAAQHRLAGLRSGAVVRASVSLSCSTGGVAAEVIARAAATLASPLSTAMPASPIKGVPSLACSLLHVPELAGGEHLLVDGAEIGALARTTEAPVSERSPLPTTRARVFPPSGDFHAVGISLGLSQLRGCDVDAVIDDGARDRHIYMVGQTGTGKSTLLLRMIVQDIHRGEGVTVIDPHGTLVDEVLRRIPRERADDVILIDPEDPERAVSLNPLVIRDDAPGGYLAERDGIIDDLLDTCKALYVDPQMFGPMFEQIFRTLFTLLLSTSRPAEYVPLLPMVEPIVNDEALRGRLVRRLGREDPLTAETVRILEAAKGEASLASMAPYVTSKLTRFYGHACTRRMLCQPDRIDLRRAITERSIVLAPIVRARVGVEAASLLARQIVRQLVLAAVSLRGQAPRHRLYVDEFHTYATEAFANLLPEARKFGLGLVLAHQHTAQLRHDGVLEAVLGNVGTVVAFRMGAPDAEMLAPALGPPVRPGDLSGAPPFRALVQSVGAMGSTPFSVDTIGVSPAVAPAIDVAIRKIARLKHGRAHEIVDHGLGMELHKLRSFARTAG